MNQSMERGWSLEEYRASKMAYFEAFDLFLGHGVGDGMSCVPGPKSQFDSEAIVQSVEERTDVGAEVATGFVGGEDHAEQQRFGADTRLLSRVVSVEPVYFFDNGGIFQAFALSAGRVACLLFWDTAVLCWWDCVWFRWGNRRAVEV